MKDTIYREDAIKSMAKAIWHYPNELYTGLNSYEMCEALAKDGLMNLPSAEPETGEWFYTEHYGERYRVCSSCGAERVDDRSTGWNFCPDCGSYNGGMT